MNIAINLATVRKSFRLFLYPLFVALCLVGFLQASTNSSSSHSANSNKTAKQPIVFNSPFQEDNLGLLRNLSMALHPPAEKIAPQVLAKTTDGNSTSIVILLAE